MMKQNPQIQTALVSTNSITQGEQVGLLWNHLLSAGVQINFAHQTFRWTNDAKGKAAVHCVIIGFALFDKPTKWLYQYADINGEGTEVEVKNINPYLVDGPNILIASRSKSICKTLPMVYGNKPVEGGFLLFTKTEKDGFLLEEPAAKKFFRPAVSAHEFLNNEERWCLWLVGADPGELKKLPLVMGRIEQVRQMRLASKKIPTQKIAATPTIFAEVRQPVSNYILVPRHSSENRDYIPIGFIDPSVIALDSCQVVPNATLYHFGILTSKMHMTWVRYTCGRLESRYRYSKDIVYNNFPWPDCADSESGVASEASGRTRTGDIERAAQSVLDARAQFPHSSLADLYDPRTMPPVLVKAHHTLDRTVDAAYGFPTTGSDTARIAFLFALYEKIVNHNN
jgi:hypothetical protein